MNAQRHLAAVDQVRTDSEHASPMTSPTVETTPLADERAVRQEIDQLHADALELARRTKALATVLDHGEYSAAGGRVRTAVTHIWRAAEDLHQAFHTAPPRCAGPDTALSRLCGRRMRYLAVRAARQAA
ncbi:DUF6238 family protein [Kitasatospora sp. MAP12-44]|uniref:DUF6238 family protein n=1 Tax=unclassified Kitasatospora TaxID=2633591 RepID=UPI002474F885|nr:DUF6238 family protein [Kitasatospora sp. MAP12-44]MDH6107968.1 hypothetical protein [Kitasatospora sp. MAP12-44]